MLIRPQPQKTKKSLKTPEKAITSELKDYGKVSTLKIGHLRLKRREITGSPYAARLYVTPDTITFLNAIGVHLGVTWDEALRGIIELHKVSNDPISGLRLATPALN
ncbi:hypothetical protein [Mucilaginibacter sp. 10I4]|uniref:hypothetical protein n=1 Tax=Mucilaginibacter sp. 10I4 TaxID=3048580 RepID=UPI002B234543|nr:hypothetical protein [Mucilaginibacter sp. 10I4]MEB0260745.1 hypothetical protein [Mucilaginibacter sp. 10I4]